MQLRKSAHAPVVCTDGLDAAGPARACGAGGPGHGQWRLPVFRPPEERHQRCRRYGGAAARHGLCRLRRAEPGPQRDVAAGAGLCQPPVARGYRPVFLCRPRDATGQRQLHPARGCPPGHRGRTDRQRGAGADHPGLDGKCREYADRDPGCLPQQPVPAQRWQPQRRPESRLHEDGGGRRVVHRLFDRAGQPGVRRQRAQQPVHGGLVAPHRHPRRRHSRRDARRAVRGDRRDPRNPGPVGKLGPDRPGVPDRRAGASARHDDGRTAGGAFGPAGRACHAVGAPRRDLPARQRPCVLCRQRPAVAGQQLLRTRELVRQRPDHSLGRRRVRDRRRPAAEL